MKDGGNVFSKTYEVYAFEVDFAGKALPATLLNFLQDAAGGHASSKGLSVPDLLKRNLTWVLSRYHIKIFRYPHLWETVTVRTWPSGKKGFFALRDFEMTDGRGESLLTATSSWMVLNLDSKQPVRVDGIYDDAFVLDRRAVLDDFPPLPVLDKEELEALFRVSRRDLDMNQHVNNVVYIQWALETVPQDILMERRPAEVEISYRAEAFFGDEIVSLAGRNPEEHPGPAFIHRIARRDRGTELARLRTVWT